MDNLSTWTAFVGIQSWEIIVSARKHLLSEGCSHPMFPGNPILFMKSCIPYVTPCWRLPAHVSIYVLAVFPPFSLFSIVFVVTHTIFSFPLIELIHRNSTNSLQLGIHVHVPRYYICTTMYIEPQCEFVHIFVYFTSISKIAGAMSWGFSKIMACFVGKLFWLWQYRSCPCRFKISTHI